MAILPSQEAAAIFIRAFEALARQHRKTLNPQIRADLARACELLATGDDYDLLDDLLDHAPPPRSAPQTISFERPAYGDPQFEAWRGQRREDAR